MYLISLFTISYHSDFSHYGKNSSRQRDTCWADRLFVWMSDRNSMLHTHTHIHSVCLLVFPVNDPTVTWPATVPKLSHTLTVPILFENKYIYKLKKGMTQSMFPPLSQSQHLGVRPVTYTTHTDQREAVFKSSSMFQRVYIDCLSRGWSVSLLIT